MSGQYRGSQAFNSVNPLVQESVNPNTGSLFLSLPIIKLSGKRSSIDLSVSLFYSAGLRGTFGLPKGWGFDLPYVLHGKSVTVNGRTFAIDKEWTDSEGHSSGLRYNNNHSIKFKRVDPEDLISGRPGQYGYIFSHADGSVDYFDIFGKPLEHHDIYGNYLYYTYVSGETEAVDSPAAKLQSITDSWGQEVIFAHDDGLQTVSLPDNTEVVIKFNNSNAYALKTPSGLTEFEYVEFDDSRAVLQKITYPSGLVSVYEHGAIEYINTKGESGYMPAVESSRSLDFDNKVYRHMKYFYGRETNGATYTGAKLGCQIGGLRDHLMDDDDRAHDYVYDVTTISLDQDEKEVAQTCNWFNNLHQPCRQTQYLLNEEQRFVEVQQTVFDYQIGEKGRAKNSSYYLPSRKGTFRNVSQTSAVEWESARRIDTTYDAYDNVTSTVDYLFDSTNNHIKQSTVETNYATTSKNVRVPIRTTTRDDVLDSLEVREYTLTEDERNIAVSRISFQGPGDTELRPWKEQNFQYDFVGRMTTTRLSWSAGAVIPEHTPSSATTKVEYKEPSNGIVCRIEIGAGGHRTEFQQDIRQKSGPIIAKTLPQGQSERFEYDSIGRLVKQINALEQATHHAYEIGPTGSTKTTTSPKGYIVKTVFDVLDREVQVLDNGDPTTPATREPTRMLSEKSYDALGRLQQSSDRFGLTTTYKSDALNRPVAEIDPFGNELGYKFEHGGAAVTHTINGDLRRIVKLDGKDRPIQTIEYPDSSHKDKISPLVHETLYSGHGKTAKKSTFQQSATEKVLLSSEASVYGPEQTVQSELTKGLGSRGIDTVHRLHVVDLFDNLAFYRKIVNYADGTTFEHAGPLQIFNESNQLACYRNQEGKEEHCQYDENGWLRQKTRFDGSGLRYTYDATGRVTAVEYPSGSSTRNTYDEDGRLVETNEDGKILKYAVTLDGTSTGETYSDGHSTNVILDCYSRPVKSTDVFGVSTESEYNSLGQISRSKCHGDTSVLIYGTVNHTFGQQVGHTCSGSTSTQTTTSYDGFGRPSLDVTQDSAGLVLLETSYKYNSRSQIEYQSSKSALAGELNTERRYQYDGLEQLIAETETFDQFTVAKTYSYDGNSNVVAVDTNGDINLLTYNAIDQRTDGGHRYDANGRMMQDNEGQTFTYDERDRLISVTSASQNASAEFGYLSDNRLAHRISSDGYISKFYHDDNLINAIYTSENDSKTECSKTSLTRNASSGIVAYQNEKYAGQALSQRGSIGLVLEADTHISSQYTAYGTRHTSTTSSNLLTDFGLTQGFTDRLSGLVHLGSRFYNPKQMSFLTMDSVHTENRYAYCEGDPVNRIDPTGHSWVDWLLAPSVGAITTLVGTAVANSLFTAALAAVANVALTAVTGGAWAVAMAVAAGVAGAVGGALGSLASNYISDKWGDRQVSGSDYLWGAIAGAAIGGITAGLTSYGNITAGADRALFTHSAKLGASVGALGGGLREFAAQRICGEEFTLGSVARIGLAAASGAASGVASGYASRYVYLREQMGRPIAMGVIAKGMWARWTD